MKTTKNTMKATILATTMLATLGLTSGVSAATSANMSLSASIASAAGVGIQPGQESPNLVTSWDGASGVAVSQTILCLYSNTGSGVGVTATSVNGAPGTFALKHTTNPAANPMVYTVGLQEKGGSIAAGLISGTELAVAASTSSNCGGFKAGETATLAIQLTPMSAGYYAAGDYADTLDIAVVPK